MSFETSPKTASTVTTLTTFHNPINAMPFNCTTPQVLDLCTRRRSGSESPKPEGARQPMKHHSPESIPEYIRNSPIITQFPPLIINNNTLEQRKSPLLNQYSSIDQSPIIEPYHNNNNNLIEHSGHFMLQNSPNSNSYRPALKSDTDSSEEGSVKSDSNSEFTNLVPNTNGKVKATRPFKAYPKDPFFLALGACSADAILGKESAEAYAEFRQKMLCQVRAGNPEPGVTNAKMRRSTIPTSTQDMDGKDASYWEKRKKNNEAAKRSRDARRAKEDEIAIRAAFLEQENLKLKYEIAALRNENTKFRCLLYN